MLSFDVYLSSILIPFIIKKSLPKYALKLADDDYFSSPTTEVWCENLSEQEKRDYCFEPGVV